MASFLLSRLQVLSTHSKVLLGMFACTAGAAWTPAAPRCSEMWCAAGLVVGSCRAYLQLSLPAMPFGQGTIWLHVEPAPPLRTARTHTRTR